MQRPPAKSRGRNSTTASVQSQEEAKSSVSEQLTDSDDDIESSFTSSSTGSFHSSRIMNMLSQIGISDTASPSPRAQLRGKISPSPSFIANGRPASMSVSTSLTSWPSGGYPQPGSGSRMTEEQIPLSPLPEQEGGLLKKIQLAFSRNRSSSAVPELTEKQVDALAREKRNLESKQLWEEDFVPNFEERRYSNKFRSYVWKGIPTHLRGKVWFMCVGNPMNITQELYDIMIKNATTSRRVVEAALKRGESEAEIDLLFPGKVADLAAIRLDLERTYPEIGFFHEGTTEHQNLRNLLEAFVCYRPDVGYLSGMSFVAGMLLLNMDPFSAFVCFSHFMSSPALRPYLMNDEAEMKITNTVFDSLLAEYIPEVSRHFASIGLDSSFFLSIWFRTIFTCLPNLEAISRIWDMWVLDKDVFLFRAALGLIKAISPRLIGSRFEACIQVLSIFGRNITESRVMKAIKSIPLKAEHVRQTTLHARRN